MFSIDLLGPGAFSFCPAVSGSSKPYQFPHPMSGNIIDLYAYRYVYGLSTLSMF